MRCERGQATIEWVGLVLLASLALGALATAVPLMDGRSFGGFLAYRITCTVRGSCDRGGSDLVRSYGPRDAALAQELAPDIVYEPGEPSIPVDFRRCRARSCGDAREDRDLDVHRSGSGTPATMFVRRIRRGGRLYLQYWLYYPDSNSTVLGSDRIWRWSFGLRLGRRLLQGTGDYPGFHPDDWEGYQVRVDRGGGVRVRASSHGHYQWCKQAACHGRWGRRTGWTRVSRGSHAGHIPLDRMLVRAPLRVRYRRRLPGHGLHERTTTSESVRLVPLEELEGAPYRRLDPDVSPPWEKEVYDNPEDPRS